MNQQHNDQLEEDPRVATYAQFSALKPPLFHKAEEPLEADAWLRAIEAKLDVLTSPCSNVSLWSGTSLVGSFQDDAAQRP
jgi:hypothetical protein